MNKFLSFVVICAIISGCDLKSKSETENQKIDSNIVITPTPSSPVVTENISDTTISIYGVWVLQAQNSTILDPAEYKSGMPYIRFDSATRKISGSTGCRAIDGNFEISGNLFSTSVINLSEGKCDQEKFENAFLAFFSAKKQVYEFKSVLLYFPGGDGKNFTFRKIQ